MLFKRYQLYTVFNVDLDTLHLSIPAQGLNGEAALQHTAYPGMQPYPGVGKSTTTNDSFSFMEIFFLCFSCLANIISH